jgi:uncharacterized protein (UPF0335 family)
MAAISAITAIAGREMNQEIKALQNRIELLENTLVTITQRLVETTNAFYSTKAIQDVINIALLDNDQQAKNTTIEYLEHLSPKNTTSAVNKKVSDDIQEMINYLRHGKPLSPEERRQRLYLVGHQNDSPLIP